MKIRRVYLYLSVLVAAISASPSVEAQSGPFSYFAVTPCRIADTRSAAFNAGGFNNGTPIMTAGSARNYFVKGTCGVPADAKAVSVNAAILNPTAIGFLSMWPAGGAFPVVSTINFLAGEPGLANGAIVPLNTCAPPCGDLSVVYGNDGSPGQTLNFVLDVTGFFR